MQETPFIRVLFPFLLLFFFLPSEKIYSATFTVNNTLDNGSAGTLRWAITQANASPGSLVNFDLGPATTSITITALLPAITGANTTIDGFDNGTSPGTANSISAFSTSTVTPLDPDYKVALVNPGSTVTVGLQLSGNGIIIKGLVIYGFGTGATNATDRCIQIDGNNNKILGCFIGGINENGTTVASNNSQYGIYVTGDNNTIGDGTAAGVNLISGLRQNTAATTWGAIYLSSTASGNSINGNIIGLQKNGTSFITSSTQRAGINLNGSTGNSISENLISGQVLSVVGNPSYGIYMTTAANSNTIVGNIIGLAADGLGVIINTASYQDYGIYIDNCSNTVIGGNTSGLRNTISGNNTAGVQIINSAAGATNKIQGNYIGLDKNGQGRINTSNQTTGIVITSSSNCLIGGINSGEENVISGNGDPFPGPVGTGIQIATSSSNVSIWGNIIGLQGDGATYVTNNNQGTGINLSSSSSNNFIGGNTANHKNVISGNETTGIFSTGGTNTSIKGNYIGCSITGAEILGSDQNNGISLIGGSAGYIIGGYVLNEANAIAFNTTRGINISGGTSNNNLISRNLIYNNSVTMTKTIDLNGTGNNNYAKPIVTAVSLNYVSGTATNNTDSVEVFKTDNCVNALQFIGVGVVQSGNWTVPVSSFSLSIGDKIIANVRNTSNNNTSEFSLCSGAIPNVSASGPATICNGDNTPLTATGDGSTFSWAPATGLNSTTGNSVSAAPSVSTTYTVTNYDGNALHTATISVTVLPLPTFSINTFNNTLCSGSSVNIEVTGPVNATYSWSPSLFLNSTTGNMVSCLPTVAGVFDYTVYATTNCTNSIPFKIYVNSTPTVNAGPDQFICVGFSAPLSASGDPGTYTWTPANYLDLTMGANVNASPTAINNYIFTVNVTDNTTNCFSNDDLVVSVVPDLTANAGSDVFICSGDTSILEGQGGSTYTWQSVAALSTTNNYQTTFKESFPGTYQVILSAISGTCFSNDTLSVTVNPLPVLSLSQDTNVCLGNAVPLSASGALSFTWSPASSLDNSVSSTVLAAPSTTTDYSVTGTAANGCTSNGSVTVTVKVFPLPTIVALPGTQSICVGYNTTITASGLSNSNYSWSPNTYISASTGSSVSVNPPNNSTYTVKGIDLNGCYNTAIAEISVVAAPTVYAGENITIFKGESVQLSGSGNGTIYHWQPLEGLSCDTCLNPVASPSASINYILTVTGNSCSTNDTIHVEVILCKAIFVPNAFSPNEDGENDEFKIYGNCIKNMTFKIFDRWGITVFESDNPNKKWNGNDKDNISLTPGIFVYVLDYQSVDGKQNYLSGNISLIK